MTARPRFKWVGWLVAAAALLAGLFAALSLRGGGDEQPPPRRGDVILMLVDTLRADHVGAYGHGRATTPAMDALAARGAVFEHAYAHSGWTLPSGASLVTGRYPTGHGARIMRGVDRIATTKIAQDATTLAQLFRRAGYRTGAFINNTFLSEKRGFDRGFDHFDIDTDLPYRKAGATAIAAVKWLAEDPKPAFLLLHVMDPHLPYDPPPTVRGRFTGDDPPPVAVPFAPVAVGIKSLRKAETDPNYLQALYDEEILGVDRALGALVRLVDQRPEKPVYLFTSDHGEEFWDHGGFEHGHTLFGELTRVPLIIAGDSRLQGRVKTPVGHVDVYQYLASLAGAAPPPSTDGEDLVGIAGRERRRGSPTMDRPILHDETLYAAPLAALTLGHQRFIVNLETGRRQLFMFGDAGQYEVDMTGGALPANLDALAARLSELRGGLEPPPKGEPGAEQDAAETERLRALGYGH